MHFVTKPRLTDLYNTKRHDNHTQWEVHEYAGELQSEAPAKRYFLL